MSVKKINVIENVLKAGEAAAETNRRRMDDAGVLSVNLMSAPGSGKTTLLEKTIPQCEMECAVLVGDLQTARDAERLGQLAAQTTQINTGKGCHLSPAQVAAGLDSLQLDQIDLVFIENVGNMVCPAAFDLGEHLRVVLLSVPEGDDKVAKYPTLFQPADAILLTKIDLIEVLDFNVQQVRDDLGQINTRAPLIELSSKTQAGFDQWLHWLRDQRKSHLHATRQS
jgi:hydrogenase nickel incorporation protein HypB